ncbi:MAG: DMT family transporter [Gammaproteobacteria bacterium]|jgi:drug/metabolite transporter (DMT)-like permease
MTPYLLTLLAMLAFAANSVLCRLALVEHNGITSIDAASFTAVRLVSGAVVLAILVLLQKHPFKRQHLNPISALMLFTYAICFSFSYINIAAGTGALILFGSVQLSMIMFGLRKGERPGYLAWTGILFAFAGLIYLVLPGISAPPLTSAILMMCAGVAWGVYSLRGRGTSNPLIATCWNFIATLPLVLLMYLVFHSDTHLSQKGILLAILSGALASGIGYAIWYKALPFLTATQAATVQLTVPIIAAIGGIVFLSEQISLRLVLASIAVLGGVYLTIKPAKTD